MTPHRPRRPPLTPYLPLMAERQLAALRAIQPGDQIRTPYGPGRVIGRNRHEIRVRLADGGNHWLPLARFEIQDGPQ